MEARETVTQPSASSDSQRRSTTGAVSVATASAAALGYVTDDEELESGRFKRASADSELGSSNEQAELPEIERTGVTARRWRRRPVHHRFTRWVGAQARGEIGPGYGIGKQGPEGIITCGSAVDDGIDLIDVNSIRIMLALGQRLRLPRRWRVRFSSGIATAVMVVAVGAMTMVAVIVTDRNEIRMHMRTKIVPGRLAAAVRVAEDGN